MKKARALLTSACHGASSTPMRLVRVAVAVPVPGSVPLTYAVPDALADPVRRRARARAARQARR